MQLAKALRDAGVKTAEERLRDIAISVRAKNPNWDQAKAALFASIRHDASLLETLFEPDRSQRLHLYLTKIDAEIRAASPAGKRQRSSEVGAAPTSDDHLGSPERWAASHARTALLDAVAATRNLDESTPIGAAKEAAAGEAFAASFQIKTTMLSRIQTFMIEGKPLAECTPREALAWADRQGVAIEWVRSLCNGVPLDDRLGRWYENAEGEVEKAWHRANCQEARERREALRLAALDCWAEAERLAKEAGDASVNEFRQTLRQLSALRSRLGDPEALRLLPIAAQGAGMVGSRLDAQRST